jgi:hypothetical protein
MAERRIFAAVRELCLAFPEAEEFESHGSPNYRARKGRVFAVWALNHHGDGHVGLWLNTPAMEQSRLLSLPHVYKPPYLGPAGWIAVELNKGVAWRRVCELAHMAYLNSSPARLATRAPRPPAVAAPTKKMTPAQIDRLLAPRAQKVIAALRSLCRALPETEETRQMGSLAWRTRRKSFLLLHDGLACQFWTGIERQGPLGMDPRFSIPPYTGHKGWMSLDLSAGFDAHELRGCVIESYRRFASRRALQALARTNPAP